MKEDRSQMESDFDLGSLNAATHPPATLEGRVVRELYRHKLITAASRKPWLRPLLAAAVCLMFIVSGMLYEKINDSGNVKRSNIVSMSETTYVLFLMQGPAYQPAADPPQRLKRIEEYRNWAISLRNRDIRVSGTKLRDERQILGNGPGVIPDDGISGYFLVDARDPQEALEIARNHPHLKYGGRIELRRVDPV
jgi:hypothetical protein